MTHKEWESGKKLTIHNATKDQLKFMVKDRDNRIAELQKELENKQKALDEAIENTAYNLIKQELSNSIILSVGHRSSLIKMHDLILLSKGSGKWQLEDSKEFVEG